MSAYAIHVTLPPQRTIVRVLRIVDGMPCGTWVTIMGRSFLSVMAYLHRHSAQYQYTSYEEMTMVFTLRKHHG